MMPKSFVAAALLAGLLISELAAAHVPIARCALANGQVQCTAMYDDGSKAENVLMNVYSYNNEVLLSGKADRKGLFDFTPPRQPFYVLMDDGPGHVFEVDWRDITGLDDAWFSAHSS